MEAARWYRKAAEQGDQKAQSALGFCYVRGEGVPTDDVVAYMWLNLSAAAGSETAATFRDKLAKSMTPQQIGEAQKMSREWEPKKLLHRAFAIDSELKKLALDDSDLDGVFGAVSDGQEEFRG